MRGNIAVACHLKYSAVISQNHMQKWSLLIYNNVTTNTFSDRKKYTFSLKINNFLP